MNVLVLYISVGDTRIGGQLIYHNENELDPMVFRQAAIIQNQISSLLVVNHKTFQALGLALANPKA